MPIKPVMTTPVSGVAPNSSHEMLNRKPHTGRHPSSEIGKKFRLEDRRKELGMRPGPLSCDFKPYPPETFLPRVLLDLPFLAPNPTDVVAC